MRSTSQPRVLLNSRHAVRSAATDRVPPSLEAPSTVKSTKGIVSYVRAPPDGGDLFRFLYELPEGKEPTNLERQEEQVTVTNLRSLKEEERPQLEQNGIQLCKLEVPDDINWDDQKEIEERYYPLAEDFLKQLTGATRVHIFDNTVRNGHLRVEEGRKFALEAHGQPVGMAHVDYTAKGGPLRLERLLPDEADRLQQTPFAVIQVWRPLKGPVQSSPLAMVDAVTVEKKDLINYRLEFPGRTGYNYAVQHNPNHRWYYTEEMEADEAYAFVCYESRDGRARFTPHTAFRDLNAKADANPRQSIEIRSFCFWENDPPQSPALEL